MAKTSSRQTKRKAKASKTDRVCVIDLINELHTLPPLARISIEVWDRVEGDWTTAKPDICEDKDDQTKFVISYLPESIEVSKS
jgi:hypothetical protein